MATQHNPDFLLEARNLKVTLGGCQVVRSVDVNFGRGELFGIIGANGSGKSTLLRAMLGLVPRDAGTVHFQNRPLDDYAARTRAREIAYLPQNADCHWPMSVERVVMLGRLPYLPAWGGPGKDDRTSVVKAMESVDVAQLAHRPVNELSGGERSRVLLARAMAGSPILLFADEPSSGLDPFHELQLMELFREYVRSMGTTVVVVLHNLVLASRFCDRLLLLNEGRATACGTPEQVLQPDQLKGAYSIEAQSLQVDGEKAVVPWRRFRS